MKRKELIKLLDNVKIVFIYTLATDNTGIYLEANKDQILNYLIALGDEYDNTEFDAYEDVTGIKVFINS